MPWRHQRASEAVDAVAMIEVTKRMAESRQGRIIEFMIHTRAE